VRRARTISWSTALADPALYTRDGQEFATRSARLALVAAELSTAYRRWEELEGRK
jgi:ABC transporter C-terminal domain